MVTTFLSGIRESIYTHGTKEQWLKWKVRALDSSSYLPRHGQAWVLRAD